MSNKNFSTKAHIYNFKPKSLLKVIEMLINANYLEFSVKRDEKGNFFVIAPQSKQTNFFFGEFDYDKFNGNIKL